MIIWLLQTGPACVTDSSFTFLYQSRQLSEALPPLSSTTLYNNRCSRYFLEPPLLQKVGFELFEVKTKCPI